MEHLIALTEVSALRVLPVITIWNTWLPSQKLELYECFFLLLYGTIDCPDRSRNSTNASCYYYMEHLITLTEVGALWVLFVITIWNNWLPWQKSAFYECFLLLLYGTLDYLDRSWSSANASCYYYMEHLIALTEVGALWVLLVITIWNNWLPWQKSVQINIYTCISTYWW